MRSKDRYTITVIGNSKVSFFSCDIIPNKGMVDDVISKFGYSRELIVAVVSDDSNKVLMIIK